MQILWITSSLMWSLFQSTIISRKNHSKKIHYRNVYSRKTIEAAKKSLRLIFLGIVIVCYSQH